MLDNLLREYAGTSYDYDERGNLVERVHNGQRTQFEWDAFNRMTQATAPDGVTAFAYDPLGRRIAKHSRGPAAQGMTRSTDALSMFGWDGDTLAFESTAAVISKRDAQTVHYVHKPDSFVPLLQTRRHGAINLCPTTNVKVLMRANGAQYQIELDALWNGGLEDDAVPFGKEEIVFYQCDHLGTPQELTDHGGKIAWAAQYKAWGQAKEMIGPPASTASIANPIRFQG